MSEQEGMLDMAYRRGYAVASANAGNKVKEAFNALPPEADSRIKDQLLDLYNDIMREPDAD